MIDQYRAKRKLFGLLLTAAISVSIVLLIAGATVAGCIVIGAAFFAFGIPFAVFCIRGIRAMKSPAPQPAPPAEEKPAVQPRFIFISPLSAGMTRTKLLYCPSEQGCRICYESTGTTKPVSLSDAAGMLLEKHNFYGLTRLGEVSGTDFSRLLYPAARSYRVGRMELMRPPADGETRVIENALGRLSEYCRNGEWIPDADKCVVADGMHDHFTAYRLKHLQESEVPKPPKPYRTRFDVSLNRCYWSVPLDESRLCFLTMVFGGDKKFMHYSLDVEAADDSHYVFGLDGEDCLRPQLVNPENIPASHQRLLSELMTDYLKTHPHTSLENMVEEVCTEKFHY